jgi:hypothetical protein
MASLFQCIHEKKKEESLFWAYELYYSGFEEYVASFLATIYRQSFWSLQPNLKKHIDMWQDDCILHPEFIGNMVINMCSPVRTYDITNYIFNKSPTEIIANNKETRLIIRIHKNDLLPYHTIDHDKETHWKILPKVCLYEVRKDTIEYMNCSHKHLDPIELQHIQIDKWLYYASYSPIWQKRIADFRGIIDHENKEVEFEEDDDLQEFHRLYGYEPDEQCQTTRLKMCHLVSTLQITKVEFAKRYGCIVKKLPKKKMGA